MRQTGVNLSSTCTTLGQIFFLALLILSDISSSVESADPDSLGSPDSALLTSISEEGWGKRSELNEIEDDVELEGVSRRWNHILEESPLSFAGGVKRAPGWGKRAPGWGKRAPGWGKRAPGWGKRAPGWGKRAPGWGKRAPGWGKRAPGWGKRAPVGGKRAPGWGKRATAPGWGKRAPGWGKRAPGWGKRATAPGSDLSNDECDQMLTMYEDILEKVNMLREQCGNTEDVNEMVRKLA
ncbi:cerebral peptide 1 [Plakobranchus ocellatus]|uniref:Cerebral peptide 1 n=1 Tax=Plakobranchus ocellatus TaxID=259542 RepID=A0AAV4E0F6_9GAST|nr:cerebral peptide 1 [Plakobranchus ocellatus]